MKKRITIKEIADLAGVNISTVSRALNPETASWISEAQREKIMAICDRLNYRPRLAAKGCATGKSFRVALILGAITWDLSSPLFALYIRGMCSVLQREGYTLSVLWAEEDPEKRDEVVRNFLMSEIADGYILGVPLLAPQTIDPFRDSGHPILSLGSVGQASLENFSTVEIDPSSTFTNIWKIIPEELMKNMLYIGPDTRATQAKWKMFSSCSGGKAAPEKLFYPVENGKVPFHYDYFCARNGLRQHTRRMLKSRLICCASDLVAYAVCEELAERGRRVGEDIYVLGYDNLENDTPCPDRKPFLSTIDPHWEYAGRKSAELILDAVRHPQKSAPLKTVISGTYIRRRSFPFDLPGEGRI